MSKKLKFLLLLTTLIVKLPMNGEEQDPTFPTETKLYIENDNALIFCRIVGEGNPLLIIHGGPGFSQDYLLPQFYRLASTRQVIFYDQRCCGLSTGEITPQTITIDQFIKDIEAIRTDLKLEKMALLGHSWGGFLAMCYALKFPDNVEKLILSDTLPASSDGYKKFGMEWSKRMQPYQNEISSIYAKKEFYEGDPKVVEELFRVIFKTYCYNPDKAYAINLQLSPLSAINGSKINEIFRRTAFSNYDLHEALRKVSIPTLIIHGNEDPIPVSTANRIHECIHNSLFIVLPNCGHFPDIECPELFFEPVEKFLADSLQGI